MKIVLATGNKGKIKEIQAIMKPMDVTLLDLGQFDVPEVVEDGETFEANALKKARAVRDAAGLCALADDSGLEVDALDGAPGVYSARYAGVGATSPEMCAKVLKEMGGVCTRLSPIRQRWKLI